MPRGRSKPNGVRAGWLGPGPAPGAPSESEDRAAIRKAVTGFVRAWARNDPAAMNRRLHPDFVNRLMGLRSAREAGAGADPTLVVRTVAGLQAVLGDKGDRPAEAPQVQVLDVRVRSASAVALLGSWVLHLHLARAGRRWGIVNAMWEMVYPGRT